MCKVTFYEAQAYSLQLAFLVCVCGISYAVRGMESLFFKDPEKD